MKTFLCIFAVGIIAQFAHTLPSTLELAPCSRSDPDINTCIINQLSKAVVALKDGVPEYDLPVFDPLFIEFMTVEGDLDAIKVKMILKNITISGHSDVQFKKVKFDPNTLTGEVSLKIPRVIMECQYYSTGRLFVIPLESSADFYGDFDTIDITLNFRLKTVQRKEVEYFSVEKMVMKMRVKQAKMKLTALNPANQAQVNVIQDFFNSNDRLVLDTVNPLVNQHGGDFYKHILEKYLRRVPANLIMSN